MGEGRRGEKSRRQASHGNRESLGCGERLGFDPYDLIPLLCSENLLEYSLSAGP